MSDTDKKIDKEKGDKVLHRLLKTPPKPYGNESLTESSQKKTSDTPAKKRRSKKS